MRRVFVLPVWLLGIGLLCQAGAIGQPSEPPKSDKVKIFCPVAGLPGIKGCRCSGSDYCSLQPSISSALNVNGAKLQFCCGGCMKTFKETPARFAVTANHQLFATGQAEQKKCPLCGGEMAKGKNVVVAGVNVATCSEDCAKKVGSANAAERANLVFGEKAFARGFVMKTAVKTER